MPLYYTDFFQNVNNIRQKKVKYTILANIRAKSGLLPSIEQRTCP